MGQITSVPQLALIYRAIADGDCVPRWRSLTTGAMRNLDQLAAEVRDSIGLIGPIDAKVLAVWLGLELAPMPYPCEGLLQRCSESGPPQVAYYGAAGETEAQRQIAHGVSAFLLADVGLDCPHWCQIERLAALLCGPALYPAPVAA